MESISKKYPIDEDKRIRNWVIFGKGYSNVRVQDSSTGREFSDIEFGYGQINFKGSKDKLMDLLLELYRDERDFKVIDYFEKDSEEYNFYVYGPDNILKK